MIAADTGKGSDRAAGKKDFAALNKAGRTPDPVGFVQVFAYVQQDAYPRYLTLANISHPSLL